MVNQVQPKYFPDWDHLNLAPFAGVRSAPANGARFKITFLHQYASSLEPNGLAPQLEHSLKFLLFLFMKRKTVSILTCPPN
jgi:hypothetical protein